MEPVFVLKARTPEIEQLVQDCADGKLPFDGPDSLYSKVAAMGFKCTSLYEMVCAVEAQNQQKLIDKSEK